ncbi:IS30 family transposase [Planococcus sp. ISL-109]|uniref:IS30 family transposase n=1 Tax=Planococcus sp. ISL-109 TaxID=2819166 RepID=UPI001BE6B13F|nr:IS30 family transposase [Planococcus sp. ISL-109]MBT2581190.1 IS30 family transposase [Planococcus sp. ISL-109]
MSYAHIISRERVLIESYCLEEQSLSYMAKQLKRSKSTIHYELKRCKPYNALLAQADYDTKRENCGSRRSVNSEDVDYTLAKLKLGWSPESIVRRYWKTHKKPFPLSISSIYRYAALDLFNLSQKLLIRKGRKLKNNVTETRGKMPRLKKIHARLAPRSQVGHWEVDTVIGKSHKSQILTLTERTTRFEIIYKLAAKTASETAQAIIQVLKNLPKKVVKSITADRGKEFHLWEEVEKGLEVPFYFADPGVLGQRGTNENSNGRIRRTYPKGTDFSRMTQKEILDFLLVFNQLPRKVLNYNTPFEVFMSFLPCST